MDCCFANQYDSSQITETFPNVSSPEMFDSDTESDVDSRHVEASAGDNGATAAMPPREPTQAELIATSDSCLLARINKYLCGVPPPPKHTTSQSDCSDFLRQIYKNGQLFCNGHSLSDGSAESTENTKPEEQKTTTDTNDRNVPSQCTKGTPRNLINAFDACDSSQANVAGDAKLGVNKSDGDDWSVYNVSKEINSANTIKKTVKVLPVVDSADVSRKQSPLIYQTIGEKEVKTLTWPQAYSHKFHGIHYNRSKTVEEFENLTVKLCERYIGAETQSTCNIWFSKQPPGSARKRSLLTKRGNGQSPEKRLTHLAKRRRTFCSANLQGLGLADKRQLMIPIRKLTHKKGKSPRGKSPRGKSPRGKSPRSSAKKKVVRRLMLDESSPCKSKVETSKRALFQSPSSDHPGPSKLLGTNNTDTQKIKRALFSTPKKSESDDAKQTSSREESRKRKCEEELQGPRLKWAKSLSFDCTHELKNTCKVTWDRYSSSSVLSKNETSFSQGKNELSNTHKKKLLWAVAEALRSKGIGMNHPKFKQYAANLARTIKKFMPDLENRNIPRKPGSTSDRMLKLAKHHVLFLIDTRPMD
ncbi:PREDICTED: uncharacterized protein LOC105560346 [Vollenhovia emeryi]|uniref:uncharacterized protein LOC105560346 n=1 Tax=Vollenhovia emeryi TaxID=411798 RepID=UPI0005F4B48E|nr:PREDICTED: uncharacterized protein LOC105560346 [Vollenhovia emeryi]